MGKILVLAEKPSVGREIARVLGCRQGGNGFLSGPNYIVTWALGHLVELEDPEHYGKEYQQWSMDTLPMLPPKMELKVIPQTAKQYSVVKKCLHDPQVDSLVIATDAGREGELVARWILEKAGFHKPIRRLWISSQTDKAIRDGFAHLRDGKEYWNLYQSAQARAEADWLVGLNVTRALTCKFNAQLSAGRVQTPTLALLVRREEEIRKFVPRDYWQLRADAGRFFVTWQDEKGQTGIFDKEKADKLLALVKGKTATVQEVKRTKKSTPPPMLYDLTELQRDANRLYQMSPKQTLNVMQSLYERYKALTYPRTDSRYLTADIVPTLTERVQAVARGEYAPIAREVLREKRPICKACINDAKVSDHHAIIPTEEPADLEAMNNEEKRIYWLVVRRFLACFFPNYEYESLKAVLTCEGQRFTAAGRAELNLGWKRAEQLRDEEEQEEQSLPPLEKGQTFPLKSFQLKACKTQPPARYTEATLLSAMENPSAYVSDKEMKGYLGGGLGTPATRADIIEKLFSSFYMEKRGNSLVPTSKGTQLISLAPEDLREPLLTAKWEQRLEAISKGKDTRKQFIGEIRSYASHLVEDVKNSDAQYQHDNLTNEICPECGKRLLSVKGKHGKMLVCQDRECGYRRTVSRETNARCPNCHKKLELFGEGENKIFVCRCGYREKESHFAKRKKETKGGASKQDVRRYLANQNKQEPAGQSAFAAALQAALNQDKK